MKVSLLMFLFILLNAVSPTAYSQKKQDYKFQHYGIEDGLSASSVTSIVQDSKGFIWVGTRNGLNKYDGSGFQVYKHKAEDSSSLSDDDVNCLFLDREGVLWIGTSFGGLNRYNEKLDNFTTFKHNPNDVNSLSGDMIKGIFQDNKGVFWISQNGVGLNRWDPVSDKYTRLKKDSTLYNGLLNCFIKNVFQDHDDELWMVYDNGLAKIIDTQDSVFIESYGYEKKDYNGLTTPFVKELIEDELFNMWVGSDDGLFLFDKTSGKYTSYPNVDLTAQSKNNAFIKSIISVNHELWLGTDGGLSIFDSQKKSFTNIRHEEKNPNSLAHDYVKVLFKDKNGAIWVGTDGGVNVYDQEREKFGLIQYEIFKEGISSSNVHAIIHDDQDRLWLGTDAGLNMMNLKNGEIKTYLHDPKNSQSLSSNFVRTLLIDQDGGLWVGTDYGLNRAIFSSDDEILGFKNFTIEDGLSMNTIKSLMQDQEGKIWIGTWGMGIDIMDRESEEIEPHLYGGKINHDFELKSGEVRKLFRDSKNRIWVVTISGLSLYERNTQRFKQYTIKGDVGNEVDVLRPRVIYESDDGGIWVGANGGRLNKYDEKQDSFLKYDTIVALSGGMIHAINGDRKGNLWLSTSNGIIKFNPVTQEFKKYDKNDGLQELEFNTGSVYKNVSGVIYFGGLNGVNFFDPNEIIDNTQIPEVYITGFQLFNKKIDISEKGFIKENIINAKTISLTHLQNSFTFEYVGLNYRNSIKNQYSYQLTGYDNHWSLAQKGNRYASYSHVPPGEYTFRVKASNDDGVWNETGASVKVVISPPWWGSSFAYGFYWVFFLTVGPAVYLVRTKSYRTRQKLLKEEVDARTIEIREQKLLIENKNNELQMAQSQIEEKNIILQELNITLEEKINKRTKELKKLADDLTEQNINLEEFNYIISHNLRAPVANIKGLMQIFDSDQKLNEANQVIIKNLSYSCDQVDEVLKDLTAILAVKNQVERPKELIDVMELIELVQSSFVDDLAPIDAEVNINLHDTAITSVKEILRSVVTQIFSNSIKFRNKDRNLILDISSYEEDDFIVMEFKDNGLGIDLDRFGADVFGLYKRFHTPIEGKGIGLYMVKLKIETLGGYVDISSKEGEYTLLKIILEK